MREPKSRFLWTACSTRGRPGPRKTYTNLAKVMTQDPERSSKSKLSCVSSQPLRKPPQGVRSAKGLGPKTRVHLTVFVSERKKSLTVMLK